MYVWTAALLEVRLRCLMGELLSVYTLRCADAIRAKITKRGNEESAICIYSVSSAYLQRIHSAKSKSARKTGPRDTDCIINKNCQKLCMLV